MAETSLWSLCSLEIDRLVLFNVSASNLHDVLPQFLYFFLRSCDYDLPPARGNLNSSLTKVIADKDANMQVRANIS